MGPTSALLVEALYAIGLGLLVGLEREHHEISQDLGPTEEPGEGKERRETVLGGRTFALLGLVGWLLAVVDDHGGWLLPIGLVAVGALVLGQRLRDGAQGVGLTTEVAALVVTLLGALVHHHAGLAVGLSLATTLLLVAKPWTRSLLVRLRRIEVAATIQLLILVAIVLPLLPAQPLDRWDALPPRKVGTFIVLIAGVGYVGYVLTRLFGRARGIGLTGLVGGLTSSTAVTASMARAARERPELIRPARFAVYLANTVMPVRVVAIAAAVNVDVGLRLAVPLGAMTVVLLGAALAQWRALRRAERAGERPEVEVGNPLSLWSALTWGAVFCAILVVSKLATLQFGNRGFLIAALASGLADVDAVTLAAAEQGGSALLDVGAAALAVTLAVLSNTIVKAVTALIAGGRAFGLQVFVVLLAAAAATVATAAVGWLVG